MTIDERFQRIEHVTAGLAEAHNKERDDARALWRNTQRQIDDLTYKLGETRDHIDAVATHLDNFIAECAARDRVTDQRFRETDARIDKLISAMGEFLRLGKTPNKPEDLR